MRKRSAGECEEDGKQGLLDSDRRGLNLCVVPSLVEPGVRVLLKRKSSLYTEIQR